MRSTGWLMLGLLVAATPAWAQDEPRRTAPASVPPSLAAPSPAPLVAVASAERPEEARELAHLRGRGATRVALGATLLSLGVLFGAVSSALWIDGSADANRYNAFVSQFQGAVAMDVIGLSMIGAGTALLAIGVGDMADARRPRLFITAASLGARF